MPATPKGGALVDLLIPELHSRLLLFGRSYKAKPADFSLRHFTGNPQDLAAQEASQATQLLPEIAREYELPKLLEAPSPREFNAKVCTENEARKKVIIVKSKDNTEWLNRGANADGIILSSRHAYAQSAAGCATLAIGNPEYSPIGAGHAGLRSVVDFGRIQGKEPRLRESIVDSLVEAFCRATGCTPSMLFAKIAFPISPAHFTYEWDYEGDEAFNEALCRDIAAKWGTQCVPGFGNKRLERAGHINLAEILYAQLLAWGVLQERIEIILPPHRGLHGTRGRDLGSLKRNMVILHNL